MNQEIMQDVFGLTTDHSTNLSMLYPYQCENFLNTKNIQSQSQSSITVFRKDMIGVKLSADKLEEMSHQKRKKCQEDPNDIII